MREPPAPGLARLSVPLGLTLTVAICLTIVPLPFTGDQALFSLGADALADGRPLYVDFWDLKQPGIFAFFRFAAATTGSSEVAVHALEVAWQVALGVVLVGALVGRLRNSVLLGLVPLLAVGLPAAASSPSEITQVESLVGLPIFLAVWLVVRALEDRSDRRHTVGLVLAGVFAFVVAAFKLLLLIVPFGCWAVLAIARHNRTGAREPHRWRRVFIPVGVGLLLPSVIFVVWAARAGMLPEIWHTWFELPGGVSGRAGRPARRLWSTAADFGTLFAPVIVLALVGLVRATPRRGDPLAQAAAAWLLAGLVAFGLQLWWFYLLFVLAVPLGVLATFGVDMLLDTRRHSQRRVAATVLVASLIVSGFTAARFARRVNDLREHDFAVGSADREAFRSAVWSPRADAQVEAEFLVGLTRRGDGVAVFGDPVILYLADRRSALGLNGWSPEHFDQQLWDRAADELSRARPELIFVDDFSAPLVEERGRRVSEILEAQYREVRRSSLGAWYRRV